MKYVHCLIFSTFFVAAFSQRSPYAGRSPIGYPALEIPTTAAADVLGNRLNDNSNTTTTVSTVTTERLPLEAMGDRDLFNRVGRLPVDRQLFWYINRVALEAQRQNQQTYEQRRSHFYDPSESN